MVELSGVVTLAAGGVSGAAGDLVILLACAGAVAMLLGRLRMAAIPGYLVAGALIGPGGLRLLADGDNIESISSLAIVLLMFTIGLHLDMATLRRGAATIITVGVVTTLGTTVLLGAVAGAILEVGPKAGLAIGAALSMSSTAVVMRLLQQRRELFSPHGRLTFGVLLTQDLLVVVMLALMPLLAGGEAAEGMDFQTAAWGAAKAVVGVGFMLVAGRFLLGRVMALAVRWAGEEVLLVLAAAVALAAGVGTAALGLSAELGAFLAGILLSSTPFRHQLSGQLAPIRDLLMAVFFTAVGLQLDARGMLPDLHWVMLLVVAVIAIKGVVIAVVGWVVGASPAIAVRAGAGLAQAGEFSLVVLAAAVGAGALTDEQASPVIAVVIASLLVTPVIIANSPRIASLTAPLRTVPWATAAALCERERVDAEDEPDVCEVIVAGFGPVGRACVDRLEKLDARCTIVELNPKTVRTQAGLGRSIVYGDVSNPDVLASAGVERSDAIVLTMPDAAAVLRAVRQIRTRRPDVFIAVRSAALSHAAAARDLGADAVTVEEIATAQAMAELVINRVARNRVPQAEPTVEA